MNSMTARLSKMSQGSSNGPKRTPTSKTWFAILAAVLTGLFLVVSCNIVTLGSPNGPGTNPTASDPGPAITSLSWSNLILSPAFDPNQHNYQIAVPLGKTTSSLTVVLTPGSSVQTGGTDLTLDTSLPQTEIVRTVAFLRKDGSTVSYSFQLNYPTLPAGSTKLTTLQFDTGHLEPDFSSGTATYVLRIAAATTGDIRVTATTDSGATVDYLTSHAPDNGYIWSFQVKAPGLPDTKYQVQLVRDEPPAPPVLGTTRPYLSLDDWTDASSTGSVYTQFKSFVDSGVEAAQSSQGMPYGFDAMHAIVLWHAAAKDSSVSAAQRQAYRDLGIALVRKQVSDAYAQIEQGLAPLIAEDSYLEVGAFLTPLAYVYDQFYDILTAQERTMWVEYANQTLFNVWNPNQAFWTKKDGTVFEKSWTGWGIDQPGNNYFYSFIRGTMAWALASRNDTWLTLLNTVKIPRMVAYFDRFPGGGSREGTGYGVAQNRLFDLYQFWKLNTGQNLALLSRHALDSISYWIHATTPTLDMYAPIGDLSRDSFPTVFDYHVFLESQLVSLFPDSVAAQNARWWLKNVHIQYGVQPYNLLPLLVPLPGAESPPAEAVYHSPGAGHLFARTGWSQDAVWMSYIAGRYDESHAHQDQGSFQLYHDAMTGNMEDNWLSVTANIWGRGGLSQPILYHNGLRFEQNGTVLEQIRTSDSYPAVTSSMTWQRDGSQNVVVDSDLTAAYNPTGTPGPVKQWKRKLTFGQHKLLVADSFDVDEGVTAVFQVQVPTEPVKNTDGSVTAGNLVIRPLNAVNILLVKLAVSKNEFYDTVESPPGSGETKQVAPVRGWVVELHNGPKNGNTGSFLVQLEY